MINLVFIMKQFSVLICCTLLLSCFSKSPEITGREGKEIPPFKVLKLDSTICDIKLVSHGKPFVVFLYGPQCPYSRDQMKTFISNHSMLSDIDIYIY